MKRFIDIKGQGTGSNFAWYCTVHDCFEQFNGNFDWDNWNEFKYDFCKLNNISELSRYKNLCPDWIFKNKQDK